MTIRPRSRTAVLTSVMAAMLLAMPVGVFAEVGLTGDGALTNEGAPAQIEVLANEAEGTSALEEGATSTAAAVPDRDTIDALAAAQLDALQPGTYTIAPSAATTLFIEVDDEGVARLGESTSPDARAWTVEQDADGYLTIRSEVSGLVLAAETSQDGARVVAAAPDDSYAQKWIATPQDDGTFELVSAVDPKLVLGVSDGLATGSAIEVCTASDDADQSWSVQAVPSAREELDALAAAHAQDLADGTYILHAGVADSSVLEVAGGSSADRANVQLFSLNGANCQQWRVNHDEAGYVTLTNVASGKVLDIEGASSVEGTNVQQYTSNGSWAQKWIAVADGAGTIRLYSALAQGVVLDVTGGLTANGTNVRIWSDNGSAAQAWRVEDLAATHAALDELAAANADAVADGVYVIEAQVGSRKVLDVTGASAADGANVQTYTSNMSGAQQWRVSHDAEGYIVLTNVASGKVLDVAGAGLVSGTNVDQYTANGTRAQRWIAVSVDAANPQAGWTLRSALYPNLVLDVDGGGTGDGVNVQVWSANGSTAQTFLFISTTVSVEPCEDILPDGWFFLSPSGAGNYVVDVKDGSKTDGSTLQIYQRNDSLAQLFRFEYVGGYYRIVGAGSGRALDVAGGNIIPPTNVQIWGFDAQGANANQQFAARDNGDGTYTFINRASGLALDVEGGRYANGVKLQAYTPNGSAAQRFTLIEQKNLLAQGIFAISPVKGSDRLLDVVGASVDEGTGIQMYSRNDTPAQKWQVFLVPGRDNTYTIESLGSGKRLAADASGRVYQTAAGASDNQYWEPEITDAGSFALRHVATGKYLDVEGGSTASGAAVQVYAGNGSDAQRFYFTSTNVLTTGTYMVHAASNRTFVLDVNGGSRSNGANVQLWSNNDSGAQKWEVTLNGDGTYTFVNARSNKALDVQGAAAYSGANVQQYQQNGSAAQKWRVTYEGGGGYKIASAINPAFVLDISGGVMADGRNIGLYEDNGSAAQRFNFTQTTYEEDYVLGVPRDALVEWLEAHENSYYLGTRYSGGFSYETCLYPNGDPRWDGYTGMNCTGFVAHAYRAVGGDVEAIARNNNHSPWASPGGGGYINAWRWYGYAIDSGAEVYHFNSVAAMLASGLAEKGDIIFFRTNGAIDCHIGFFWGDSPSENKMWHQILPGNLIGPAFNNANKAEINQQTVLIK